MLGFPYLQGEDNVTVLFIPMGYCENTHEMRTHVDEGEMFKISVSISAVVTGYRVMNWAQKRSFQGSDLQDKTV